MRNSAGVAELLVLSERLVPIEQVPAHWAYCRKGLDSGIDLLRYLHHHTSGKYAIGHKFIAFENKEDTIIYKIAYPG